MKLSIAWIFDHIDADWKKLDIPALIKKFNVTTAEIEAFSKLSVNLKSFALAQVIKVESDSIMLNCPEWKQEITLPSRPDAKDGSVFLIIKKDGSATWASALDLHGVKEGPLPALHATEQELQGGWKKTFETEDYIFELDNKSITNRPDMWGHRGFAREIAAILDLPLKPLEQFLADRTVKDYESSVQATAELPISIINKAPKVCRRFAGMYIDKVSYEPSRLWMAHRLARVETRAIDLLVDLTNYVMLDLSQPMHVFDVNKLTDQQIVPRMAKKGEKLELLDDQAIELSDQDLVITDGRQPVALAGVMGGKLSGISPTTNKIFIESANFEPASVRLSAARYKVRTESSARFEKGLDPNQNILGIKRLLKLLIDAGTHIEGASGIASVGSYTHEQTIDVSHEFIVSRIGVEVGSDFVVTTLEKIGFVVNKSGGDPIVYAITVPSYRSSGVTIPEDIVEEVARFFGYSNIPLTLPLQQMHASDLSDIFRERLIKRHIAYALYMNELQHYALYDDNFLREINWEPTDPVEMLNPVSSDKTKLLTTLMPHMFKSVRDNAASHSKLRFFEWSRTWHQHKKRPDDQLGFVVGQKGPFILEKKMLAGIIFDGKENIDFYKAKAQLNSLFTALDLPVQWSKLQNPEQPWYHEYQTACLMHDGNRIGIAGKVSPVFFANVTEGDAFIFELDSDFLLRYKAPTTIYQSPSKYPHVWLDISLFVPLKVTVEGVVRAIQSTDKRIVKTELIDFFTKDEWGDKKSLTFRFVIKDETKTLSKDEIDNVWVSVVKSVEKFGAQVR